jgi:hypothetical protein
MNDLDWCSLSLDKQMHWVLSYENPPLKKLHYELKITRIIFKPPHQLKSLVGSNTTLKVCFTN